MEARLAAERNGRGGRTTKACSLCFRDWVVRWVRWLVLALGWEVLALVEAISSRWRSITSYSCPRNVSRLARDCEDATYLESRVGSCESRLDSLLLVVGIFLLLLLVLAIFLALLHVHRSATLLSKDPTDTNSPHTRPLLPHQRQSTHHHPHPPSTPQAATPHPRTPPRAPPAP